jgi:tetratricopeptide (TPR) repeat protein
MKNRSWYIMAALVALALLATSTRLSAQDWKGNGRVAGKVVDDSGKPVANAVVKLRLVQADNTGPDVTTDKHGEFSALQLRGGTWNIDVQAPGYAVQRLSVTLPAGDGRIPPVDITVKKDVAGAQQKELQGLLGKGDELYKAGKFAEARAEYQKVLAARPDLIEVHRSIALTYGREGNYAGALKEIDAVLERYPNDNTLLQLAADAALRTGNTEQAAQYVSRLDMSKINDPAPIVNIAIAALNKNQPNIAMQALDPVITRFPQAPDPYYFRALAELQLQQMDKAKPDLEKFISLAPPDSKEAQQAKEMLAQIKQAGGVSMFVTVPRAPGDRPVINPQSMESRQAAAPAYQLRR